MLPVAHACILCPALHTIFIHFLFLNGRLSFHLVGYSRRLWWASMCCFPPHGNKKLKALLRGTFLHRIFFFASVDDFVHLTSGFFDEKAVYLRFSRVSYFQPKFCIGYTSSSVLGREHTRFRKFLQVQQNKFVLAEVALRFWNKYGNFWMWSILPSYDTGQSNF